MSSVVFDIGNFVIWSWLILAPVVYLTLQGIHEVDNILRNDFHQVGCRFWRGKWHTWGHEGNYHVIALMWAACLVSVAIVYGDMHREWDLIPLSLHMIDCLAEPVGWLVVIVVPVLVLKFTPWAIAFFISKWSK